MRDHEDHYSNKPKEKWKNLVAYIINKPALRMRLRKRHLLEHKPPCGAVYPRNVLFA